MKAGASILLSFVVGALAAIAVLTTSSNRETRPEPAGRMQAVQERPREAKPVRSVRRRVGLPALINIPRLHLKATIGTKLDKGPAWWPVTGRPGGGDTVAIAGHRTTHTRPFHSLERIRPGDAIYIRWRGRVHAYRMSGRRILSAKDLHIGDARRHEILLLTACHPKGSARQRIVVYAWPRPQTG